MFEKIAFDRLARAIHTGAATVVYWDGATKTYGTGEPYFTITFRTPHAIRSILKNRTLGFGESYASGDIEIDGPLDQLVRLISQNGSAMSKNFIPKLSPRLKPNTKSKQRSYIHHHYDIGNDFYKLWLDKSLAYSCAYFKKESDSLETAQKQKVDHILKKLRLGKDMSLLDIGCGWGTLLFRAAEKYPITGLGITLSEEQFKYCKAEAKKRGLSHRLKFKLLNYNDLAATSKQQFDRIVSVGMFEHVGKHNHDSYFAMINTLLKQDGVSLLHAISQPQDTPNDPWIDKYIFPGGYLPTVDGVTALLPDNNLRLVDYESLKFHYALTLEEWHRRYKAHRKEIVAKYDEKFYRTWELWLANSGAGFRYDSLDLSQFIFVKRDSDVTKMPLTREYIYR